VSDKWVNRSAGTWAEIALESVLDKADEDTLAETVKSKLAEAKAAIPTIGVGMPPRAPTDLALEAPVGQIQASWTDALVTRDFAYYEVVYSQNSAFTAGGTVTHKVSIETDALKVTDGGVTYYVRVRTASTSGVKSSWSGTATTISGVAETRDIASEATAKLTSANAADSNVLDSSYETIVSVSVTKDEGTDSNMIIQCGCVLDAAGGATTTDFRIRRDSTDLLEYTGIVLLNSQTQTIYLSVIDAGVAAGTYTYTFQGVDTAGLGASTISVASIIVQEVKR
jgi:hypothetical protein